MHHLFSREVTRKDFLLTGALLLLSALGITKVFQRISPLFGQTPSLPKVKAVKGFGSGPYGA